MEKFMLTPREACECTGIGEKQIRYWAKNDTTFPALSVGVDIHIPYDELKAWLSNRARLRVGLKHMTLKLPELLGRGESRHEQTVDLYDNSHVGSIGSRCRGGRG